MLYIVLAIVVVAFALLIAALVLAATGYAWASLGFSVLAAIVLVVDSAHRRDRSRRPGDLVTGKPDADSTTAANAIKPSGGKGAPKDPDAEPDEEDTDAADLLVVSELDAEVRVLDEHPRYHRSRCDWLAGRPTLAVAVKEARELGFTPCAVCAPDSALVAEHRATHNVGRQ